jgi:polyisoprenoid-binding protein YceI
MKIKKLISFIILVYVSFAFSQTTSTLNTEWQVSSYTVKFKIKNAGFTIDGKFEGLVAKVLFDETKSFGNSIEATVDAKTVNTESKSRDGHLKKTDFFEVAKYPKITMQTNVIGKEKDGSYKGYFKLSMKDKTKDVTIPFTFVANDNTANLKGSFTINRLDYGVGGSSMILSNNATLFIDLNLTKK